MKSLTFCTPTVFVQRSPHAKLFRKDLPRFKVSPSVGNNRSDVICNIKIKGLVRDQIMNYVPKTRVLQSYSIN